jgi:predicted extracellular nuclease
VIGQLGVDPGAEWGTGLTSTADNTLRRKPTIQAGDPTTGNAFDPAAEWDGFATDTFDGLGSHSLVQGDLAPTVASTTPANDSTQVALDTNVTLTFSEPVAVTGSWFAIACTASGDHPAAVSGGPTTFTLDPASDFAAGEACTVSIAAAQVTDLDVDDPPDQMATDFAFSFTTPVEINDIQGASHTSPLVGRLVSGVAGTVTARLGNGFYVQDPTPDADDATSDALFVFTSSAPTVAVGDEVLVAGRVSEFRPGGATSTNLTTTEIVAPAISVLSSGNPLPAATVLGAGGRTPPTTVIEDDAAGSVETSGVFDPEEDGIDFYESLEAMRAQVNNALAVGPSNQFGEIPVVGDAGAAAGIDTVRGGVVISPGDFNPERIFLDDTILPTPVANVADRFMTAVGVLDYSFGNYKLNVTAPLTRIDGGLEREQTRAPADWEIVVGTYNVENLDPGDGAAFARHAGLIVDNLQAPDLIAIEEIQDNDGPVDSGTTDASASWDMLIAAIRAAGGPEYEYRQIDPVNNADGGQAGEFRMHGKKVFVVANHFSSKGGDDPLFGRFQPPTRVTETARHAQAQVVNDFVDRILAVDRTANVIVLGDINDFEFSQTVDILEGGVLTSLMDTLPKAERYSYVFEGNSQVLDQILVSDNLLESFGIDYDPVHVNSEFADQASDHDPQVARLDLRGGPVPK